MKITLNNNPEELLQSDITIAELLDIKKFTWKLLIIKVNGSIIKRHEYETVKVNEGDDVSVIHLITGG